jgi:hypothetical protein
MKISRSFLPIAWMVFLVIWGAGCKDSARQFGELTALAGDKTDKGIFGHGFTDVYERFFYPLKYKPIRICEIGIDKGESLRLWEKYFPKASICGIDIDDKSFLNSKRIHTFVADQGSRSKLRQFLRTYGGAYDIILDDGGHDMNLQQISFSYLFPSVKPGGLYIIEDVHTSLPQFYPGFGVDPDGANSTLRMIQHFTETGKIESPYMTRDEIRYLNQNIEYAVLFAKNSRQHSMTCIFRKVKRKPGPSSPVRSFR